MEHEILSPTWLNGKHYLSNGYVVEINTSFTYVAIDGGSAEESYYFDGDKADKVIDEINLIYNTYTSEADAPTAEEAIYQWINLYL